MSRSIIMKRIILLLVILAAISCGILFLSPESKKIIGLDDQPPKIGILPFGSISNEEVDSVQTAIQQMYDFDVAVLNTEPMPEVAYTTIRYPRYRADTLLGWLADFRPDSIDILLGLTNKDISVTKYQEDGRAIKEPEWKYKDFGIFGLGRVNGTVCVVSSNRLHKGVSDRKFYKRLTRISCHEVGHVLGLRHCPESNCLMNDANESIKTVDKSTGDLCQSCWNKIH